MRTAVTVVTLVGAALVALVVALSLGSTIISPSAVLQYLFTGDSGNTGWTTLLHEFRLPRIVTAICAGIAMGIAGLLMQTVFANPLAEPYILGVSAGAGLGVGLVVLGTGGTFAAAAGGQRATVTIAAGAGAAAVLTVVLVLSRWVRSSSWLLIVGVMISSLVTSVVSLLLAYASPEQVQEFVMWGLGSFSGVIWSDLAIMIPVVTIAVVMAVLLIRPLDALLLGESYAKSMGVRTNLLRTAAVVATALLAGVVTAYCGPIAFIGIAAPHIARMLLGRSGHAAVLPVTALVGAAVALVCSALTSLPGDGGVLPVNVLTAMFGAPVVVLVLIRSLRSPVGTS